MDSVATKTLQVRISRAAEVVFEGEAESVSSSNSDGPFDILPLHAHFISIILDQPIVIRLPNGTVNEYRFTQSVMEVKDDTVNIYADIYSGL
jgi:F0F1-type ATP synthase epsilon subunit